MESLAFASRVHFAEGGSANVSGHRPSRHFPRDDGDLGQLLLDELVGHLVGIVLGHFQLSELIREGDLGQLHL